MNVVKIIAHRGYTKNHPENTLSAFKAALEIGADAIELDVHASKDGELFVHHDYYLKNPDNDLKIISEQNSSYITSLYTSDQPIPKLEQVFNLMGASLQYEIELKGYMIQFLKDVTDIVKKYRLEDKVEFTSPHPYVLTKLKTLHPSFKIGSFITPFPNWMESQLGRTLIINNALMGNVNVLHCPIDMIDRELVDTAHSHNLKIHAADCNSEIELRKAFGLNLDQLSTDTLNLALQLRKTVNTLDFH